MEYYDYIVIGAGASGLSFAALMEKKGFKVAVLEAHTLPGGCSSYFDREGFTFDAGATTLSGMAKGRPLNNLIKELDLQLELVSIDPGIISIIGDQKISHHKNTNQWIAELSEKFPGIDHQSLWEKLKKIERRGWNLSTIFKNIPMRSARSLLPFFSLKLPGAVLAIPEFFTSVKSELEKYNIKDQNYLDMINELLFITAQNQMETTPLLMGAMGLCYPEDTSYAMGGMKAFSQAIAAKCSHLFFKEQVKKIEALKKGKEGFSITTITGKVFHGKKLISTIPIWNHAEMFEDQKARDFFSAKKIHDPKDCWSAFMIYLTIPINTSRVGLYFQIHCPENQVIPNCSTKSFFVSLSHPEDKSRSIKGRQVVTISTHTKPAEWIGLDKEQYKLKKIETENYILGILKQKFQLGEEDLQNKLTGTPKTFIKYTKRSFGLVGGIPHSLNRNPMELIFAKSPYKNFYMLGDTQFPGQGIAAVVMGSMNLVDYLAE